MAGLTASCGAFIQSRLPVRTDTVPQSRSPQDRANRRTGVAVLAEQFEPGGDQSSTSIRNAFICGLTVVIPHLLAPWVDVAAAPFATTTNSAAV